jgi:hypothetical protein
MPFHSSVGMSFLVQEPPCIKERLFIFISLSAAECALASYSNSNTLYLNIYIYIQHNEEFKELSFMGCRKVNSWE